MTTKPNDGGPAEKVNCRVCRTLTEPENITHLSIYVEGSEGVNVCLQCRQTLTEVLRGMMRANFAGRKQGYLTAMLAEREKGVKG